MTTATIPYCVQPYARFVIINTDTTTDIYDLSVSLDRPLMVDTLLDALAFVNAHVRAGEWANLIGLDGKARRVDYPNGNAAKEQRGTI